MEEAPTATTPLGVVILVDPVVLVAPVSRRNVLVPASKLNFRSLKPMQLYLVPMEKRIPQ